MADRLSSQDVSFLYLEQSGAAMHVGSVMIFEPGHDGLDIDRLTRHVAARIAYVPRYRQRLRGIPGRLANPVWVDDGRFDLGYHVRRSAIPRPGSDEQLAELVSRLQARPLDRRRPLWELILVEGLSDGRYALVTKVHQALVDGVRTVDLGQVVLDESAEIPDPPPDTWRPAGEPSGFELLAGAVATTVRRPGELVGTVRSGVGDVRLTAERTARSFGGLLRVAGRAAGGSAAGPLTRTGDGQRAFAMIGTDLEDYRRVRAGLNAVASGDDRRTSRRGRRPDPDVPPADDELPGATVNDVVLATLTGALRAWLLTRGEPVPAGNTVRTLVPMSVRAQNGEAAGAIGSRVASLLVDLPTGEPSPAMRLHQIAYQTQAHRDTGLAVDAPALAGITGFAPPTLHSLGARVASGLSRRMFHLVVTNVPGPQQPLYLDGARMLSSYPVVPLTPGQALSVGLTSYDGGVFYGLNADREAVPDLDVVGQCIRDALAELVEAVR